MYTDFKPEGKIDNNSSHANWMNEHKVNRQKKYVVVIFDCDYRWIHWDVVQEEASKVQ